MHESLITLQAQAGNRSTAAAIRSHTLPHRMPGIESAQVLVECSRAPVEVQRGTSELAGLFDDPQSDYGKALAAFESLESEAFGADNADLNANVAGTRFFARLAQAPNTSLKLNARRMTRGEIRAWNQRGTGAIAGQTSLKVALPDGRQLQDHKAAGEIEAALKKYQSDPDARSRTSFEISIELIAPTQALEALFKQSDPSYTTGGILQTIIHELSAHAEAYLDEIEAFNRGELATMQSEKEGHRRLVLDDLPREVKLAALITAKALETDAPPIWGEYEKARQADRASRAQELGITI